MELHVWFLQLNDDVVREVRSNRVGQNDVIQGSRRQRAVSETTPSEVLNRKWLLVKASFPGCGESERN